MPNDVLAVPATKPATVDNNLRAAQCGTQIPASDILVYMDQMAEESETKSAWLTDFNAACKLAAGPEHGIFRLIPMLHRLAGQQLRLRMLAIRAFYTVWPTREPHLEFWRFPDRQAAFEAIDGDRFVMVEEAGQKVKRPRLATWCAPSRNLGFAMALALMDSAPANGISALMNGIQANGVLNKTDDRQAYLFSDANAMLSLLLTVAPSVAGKETTALIDSAFHVKSHPKKRRK